MEMRELVTKYLARPAFKQTEVGLVPEDWKVCELGDFQPFITSGSRGWAGYYSGTGSSFMRITNLSRECIYPDLGDLRFVSIPEGDTEGVRTQLKDEDVLISITADIGIVGYVTQKIPKPAYINQHIALVRFNRGQACSRFVAYFLAADNSQKLFRALTDSGAKAGMSLATVQKIKAAFPPTVEEQQAIAAALTDADALIEALEQLLAKKCQIKQGAMQELLTGQKRLPGFTGKWSNSFLGEVAPLQRGFDLPNGRLRPGPYPVVYSNGVLHHHDQFQVKGPGVVTGRSGTIGAVTFVHQDYWPHNTSLWVTSFKGNDPKFIFYLYSNIGLERFATGSGVPTLNRNDVHGFRVNIPPNIGEQTAIAAVLSDMDAEIAAVEERLAKARQLKQGMMQELLTGRIRLVQPKAEVIPFPEKEKAPSAPEQAKPRNRQFEEAVMLGVFAKAFGSESHPLARVRRTKLLYLLHRHVEGSAAGYLKKAAGPYNPKTRYQGPEGIAQRNGYVRPHRNGAWEGFVAGEKIADAEAYFDKWFAPDVRAWLEQFRYIKTEELELLATVDMAMEDLRREGEELTLEGAKRIIRTDPEWEAKLERPIFLDANIECAMAKCRVLFRG